MGINNQQHVADVVDSQHVIEEDAAQPVIDEAVADQNNIGMEVEVESDEAAPFAVRLPLISPVKSPRKRKRNVHLKKVHRDQKRRNEGREYKTKNGKLVESRTIGEMCNCPLKCKEKVSDAQKLTLFNSFWDMSDFNLQNSYLFGCVELVPVKRRMSMILTLLEENTPSCLRLSWMGSL